jgi:hypothetical protein
MGVHKGVGIQLCVYRCAQYVPWEGEPGGMACYRVCREAAEANLRFHKDMVVCSISPRIAAIVLTLKSPSLEGH